MAGVRAERDGEEEEEEAVDEERGREGEVVEEARERGLLSVVGREGGGVVLRVVLALVEEDEDEDEDE